MNSFSVLKDERESSQNILSNGEESDSFLINAQRLLRWRVEEPL